MTQPRAAPLLEREGEISELREALREARREHGQIVLIEAAAGIGKTSLLWAAADAAAEAGFLCLRTRASEIEHHWPYGCLRRLLEPAIAKTRGAERKRLFEDAAGHAVRLFAPGTAAPAETDADGAFALPHGLYWLLNNVARDRSLALCIDDLQWADVESLRFLRYLAPRLDGLPVAVLATVRSRENATADLARLLAAPEAKLLRPKPLSVDAVATVCEQRLDTEVTRELAAACHAATGGNPFFLHSLLREATELGFLASPAGAARIRRIGPDAVARAVSLRLASAPPAATALVRAIAVLGDSASVVDAARLADLPGDEAARTADALIDLGILKPSDELEFAHPIVRRAVYEHIGAHERASAHAHAARVLAQRNAADELIAAHLAKAEPVGDPERVQLLRRAARRALAQGAPGAAVAWLTRALAEPPPPALRPEMLLELGTAELRLGMPEAVGHLSEAAATLEAPERAAVAARERANALSMSGDIHAALSALDSAIAAVEARDPESALVLEAELGAKALQASPEVRADVASCLARHADLTGATPGERLVLATLAFHQARASETEREAVRLIEQALSRGGLFGQQADVVGALYALVIGLLATDALELAHAAVERALAEARARASIPAMAYLTAHRGWFSLRAGDVAVAEADARMALELMRAHDIRLGDRFALALLVEALLEMGQAGAAAEALRDSGLGDDIPPRLANNALLEARGLLHLARGDTRAALADFREFGRREELQGAASPAASRWRVHACLALHALGDGESARRLAGEELERARRWGSQSGIGTALRVAALVDGGPLLAERLREAAGVLERSPGKLEHARTLVDLGAAERRANRRAEARLVLEQGLELARRCGAAALAERAATELRAAGGRSAEPGKSGLAQLTVSERRVAELVAQGRSNPQVAQALFVTRKTVETHLGRVYSKLGVSGRTELARVWAEMTR